MSKLLTPLQVSKKLGVCRESVWRYVRKGKLRAIKLTPRNFRITEKDFDNFLKRCKRT